jgi:hypothetical protein
VVWFGKFHRCSDPLIPAHPPTFPSETGRNSKAPSFSVKRKFVGAPQNIVGPVVRKIRYGKSWTQAMLAARCSRVGWDIGENTISKIEAQLRCVTDGELVYLARALQVKEQELFPANSKR